LLKFSQSFETPYLLADIWSDRNRHLRLDCDCNIFSCHNVPMVGLLSGWTIEGAHGSHTHKVPIPTGWTFFACVDEYYTSNQVSWRRYLEQVNKR
jgi:hypothetical protein